MASRNRDYFTLGASQKPTVGDTKFSVIQWDHLGWLKCDGRSVAKADYYFLWEIIGYSFGGSGDNFNLPNPAGRVPGVIGSGSGLTTRGLGSNVGEETHTLTVAEMPTHAHTQTTINDDFNNSSGTYGGNYAKPSYPASDGAGSITWTSTINATGGSNAHNIMQPTLFMGNMFIYCGKYGEGYYPYDLTANVL